MTMTEQMPQATDLDIATHTKPLQTLVAIDGSDAAIAALSVAGELSAAGRIAPTLVSISGGPPFGLGAPMPSTVAVTNALLEDAGEREWFRDVRAHVIDVLPEAVEWPVRLVYGYSAEGIDTTAVREQAELIVMGLHRHDWMDRASKL